MRKIEKVYPSTQVGKFSGNNPHNSSQHRNDSKDKAFSDYLKEQEQKHQSRHDEVCISQPTPSTEDTEDFQSFEAVHEKVFTLSRHFVEPSRPPIHRIDPYEK